MLKGMDAKGEVGGDEERHMEVGKMNVVKRGIELG